MVFEPYQHVFRTMPNKDDESYEHSSFLTHKLVRANSGCTTTLYHCELCAKSFVEALLKGHCRSKAHISRVKQIQRMQKNPTVRRSAAFQNRIDQLGLPSWQTAVQLKLYWILLYQDVSERPQVLEMKIAANAIICKYERLERISLLELAVWKAVCIIMPRVPNTSSSSLASSLEKTKKPEGINEDRSGVSSTTPERTAAVPASTVVNIQYDYHTWQEWIRQGWKSSKSVMRNANEIAIIVTSVVPFLVDQTKSTTEAAAATGTAPADDDDEIDPVSDQNIIF